MSESFGAVGWLQSLKNSADMEEAPMMDGPAASGANVAKDELLGYYRDMLLIRPF